MQFSSCRGRRFVSLMACLLLLASCAAPESVGTSPPAALTSSIATTTAPEQSPKHTPGRRLAITVKPGQSLGRIAENYHVSKRAIIAANREAYSARERNERALSSIDFQSSINLLKVEASELAVTAVMHAMRACGLSGYRNDTDVSIGRHLRDVLSAPIMINNDRILASMGAATLMSAVPASLRD